MGGAQCRKRFCADFWGGPKNWVFAVLLCFFDVFSRVFLGFLHVVCFSLVSGACFKLLWVFVSLFFRLIHSVFLGFSFFVSFFGVCVFFFIPIALRSNSFLEDCIIFLVLLAVLANSRQHET